MIGSRPFRRGASVLHHNLHHRALRSRHVRYAIELGYSATEAVALAGRDSPDLTERRAALITSLQPDGLFAARAPDGRAIGIVSCVSWDRVAWIGSLLVEPASRGHHIGRKLLDAALDFAQTRAEVIGLDTPPQWRTMFERAGFVALGEGARCSRRGAGSAPTVSSDDYALYPVSPAEIMELIQCDTPRFGAPRGRYLAAIISEEPHRAFVAIHRKTGAFSGHVIGLDDRIGPLVADTPAAAAWLLHAVERAGTPPEAIVPSWNPAAGALFAAAGYGPGEVRIRMIRGAAALPGRCETQYGIGDWALG